MLLGMANQPRTPLVAFRYGRGDELRARAARQGVTVSDLLRAAVDRELDHPQMGVDEPLDSGVIHL